MTTLKKDREYLFTGVWSKEFYMKCIEIDSHNYYFYYKDKDNDKWYSSRSVRYTVKQIYKWYAEGKITPVDIVPEELFEL